MTRGRVFAAPWNVAGHMFAGGARRAVRNVRLAVPVCVALICGCFAAVAILQMRLDRTHALAEATLYESARAADLAAVAGEALDRYEAAGLAWAANPDSPPALPGLINIAVLDSGFAILLHPGRGMPPLPPPTQLRRTSVFAFDGEAALSIVRNTKIVIVLFHAAALAPTPLLRRAALLTPGGDEIAGARDLRRGDAQIEQHRVPGWPLVAATAVDTEGALAAWYGALPLYLFVILGPALVGGWLAALFVGSFERQQKAAQSVRALKSVRPVEARLLVRLANAERAAVESLRAKSEFIAHMSHELRTPLNAVIGFSEVIEQGFYGPAGHPKYVEYAHDIAAAGRGLHAKIGDILEFANIEAGRYPLNPARIDLAELAAACVDEHRGRAFSRRIALDIGFCAPGDVRADPLAVRRILSNLLANALAYTQEGGTVRVDVRLEEGAGVVAIQDSGLGFSGAERKRAGGRFQRFDRSGTVTGAGLGLAIAMELARCQGGAMRIDSIAGNGALMELRLPRI